MHSRLGLQLGSIDLRVYFVPVSSLKMEEIQANMYIDITKCFTHSRFAVKIICVSSLKKE